MSFWNTTSKVTQSFSENDLNTNQTKYDASKTNFLAVTQEGERWCRLMNCETVADLNLLTQNGNLKELIRINEALHEETFSQIADEICTRNAKVVMLAGPSSSGKTTSANRLATQLRVNGKKPLMISLDDYYIDRNLITPCENGELDLEHIKTIDTSLFSQHMISLLQGIDVEIPTFNFITGKRELNGKVISLRGNSVIIVEGLHALNPILIPGCIDQKSVFRLYISAILSLKKDDHKSIPSSSLRLLRRIARDYAFRGTPVIKTIQMWDSVQRGERRWIFPFQESADLIFNSSTLYELAVLKKYVYTMLQQVASDECYYKQVEEIIELLDSIYEAEVDEEIPPTSIVREFIGGSSFYK